MAWWSADDLWINFWNWKLNFSELQQCGSIIWRRWHWVLSHLEQKFIQVKLKLIIC